VAGVALSTPLLTSPVLDARAGCRVLLKAESLQRIGAFKIRGAYNKISQLDRAAWPGGVVACSSGNHAQGVAAAASLLGFPALIVMPKDAPQLKIDRTRALGAEVYLFDREKDDRDALARDFATRRGAAVVPPFDDPDVIAGQGTVGLELMKQANELGLMPDCVLVPCSGGGLSTGVALAVKAVSPSTDVHPVEPAEFDDFGRSLDRGERVRNQRLSGSICDALMSPTPGEITFALGQKLLSPGLSVSDAEVAEAVRFAFTELKLVVEPGGAVALAAVLAGKVDNPGRTLACVLSGGNIDPGLFGQILAS
jgi:threonine dehydratase